MSAVTTDGCISVNESRVRAFDPFHETLEFFNNELGRPVVLGGGCIRDLWIENEALIKDYDVWVLGVLETEIADLDARLSNGMHHLMAHNVHSADPKVACTDYPNRKFHSPKANLKLPWIPNDKPVQLMYTPCKTMMELLDQFDWHVCSFGFDGETVISKGESDFVRKQLTLNPDNALRSPRSTLRRGFRLEDKFRGTSHRLSFPNELILALAAMLTLNGEGKKD
jgi:hypothetical protein